MANRERHKRIYDLHSWTGIVLGIMLFVVCFTGCLAMFHDEFVEWEDPVNRLPVAENPIPINDIFVSWLEENRKGRDVRFASVASPGNSRGYYEGFASFPKEGGEFEQVHVHWDSRTGEALPVREEGANRFLFDLHRDLAWPEILGGRQVGRALVGVVGIAFMLIILSGVIAHSKITKELFSLRYLRSVRLKWQDTHKVLGLWSLPFSVMIAFTGAFLGIVSILLPLMAAVTVKGDTDKLANALGLGEEERAGIVSEMQPVDRYFAIPHPETGAISDRIFINNWGDKTASYTLNYPVDDRLVFFDQLKFSAVDGEQQDITSRVLADELLPRMLGAISPLHYGIYGGAILKIGYVAMGLALAVMAALGNMMWIERRLHGGEGNKGERFYRRLSALTTGICAGLPVASFSAILFDQFYWGTEAARYVAVAQFFFSIWFVALIFAFARRNAYLATRELVGLTGALLLALPVVNGLLTGDFFWLVLGTGSAWFDIAFVVLGFATLASARKMPRQRPADKRRDRKKSAADSDIPSELQPAE